MERKLIAAAVSSALVLPMAAQAVEFSVSGQINRALISVDGAVDDDGKELATNGDIQHVDADSSNTRFRMVGSEELDSGMTAGVQLEWAALNGDDDGPTIRQANVSLSAAGGKLTIGQASVATDGMAHADLGGASFLGGVTNWCSYAGSGPACPSNDGGRMDVLRYDTPAIGPASIAFSVGNDDYWDAKLSISGSMGDAGYDLRIGHIGERDSSTAVAGTQAMPEMTVFAEEYPDSTDLLGLLAMENPADASLNTNPGNDDNMADPTATNTDATDAIQSHVDANDDVVAIELIDGEIGDPLVDSAYRKTTRSVIDAVAAVPGSMKEVKAGDITTASAAFSFGQGTSVALAWSQNNATDNEYQYVKLDHSYGDGSVAVYYKSGETGDVDGSHLGVAIGHSLGGGATAYAGFRQMAEDGKEDVDLIRLRRLSQPFAQRTQKPFVRLSPPGRAPVHGLAHLPRARGAHGARDLVRTQAGVVPFEPDVRDHPSHERLRIGDQRLVVQGQEPVAEHRLPVRHQHAHPADLAPDGAQVVGVLVADHEIGEVEGNRVVERVAAAMDECRSREDGGDEPEMQVVARKLVRDPRRLGGEGAQMVEVAFTEGRDPRGGQRADAFRVGRLRAGRAAPPRAGSRRGARRSRRAFSGLLSTNSVSSICRDAPLLAKVVTAGNIWTAAGPALLAVLRMAGLLVRQVSMGKRWALPPH